MAELEDSAADRVATLAVALRTIRLEKGLGVAEAARAMGLPQRTYRRFESGKSAATPERLKAFSEALDCDYAGLLLVAGGLYPQLAAACCDNKAITQALDALGDLHAAVGAEIGDLTTAELLAAFDMARLELQASAARRQSGRAGEAAGRLLTARQLECLRWAQAGKSSTDIGAILGISPRTVDDYLEEACTRLRVRTRVQAISRAIELGLLSPRAP